MAEETARALELFTAEGKSTDVWMCTTCRLLYGGNRDKDGRPLAERCCHPICARCQGPGRKDGYRLCDDCQVKRDVETNVKRLAEAEKLETWDSWVYQDGAGQQDGFFPSMEDFLTWLEERDDEEGTDWPQYVHVCEEIPFDAVDPSDVYERCTENSFDEASDQLQGLEEFEAACAAFNEANKGLVSFTPDYKRAVRVPPRKDRP